MSGSDKYTGPNSRSHSRSGSTSSSRQPSLTRSRSSQRLIRTISFDRDDEVAIDFLSDNELDMNKLDESLSRLETDTEQSNDAKKPSNLPNLTGLKVDIGPNNSKNPSKNEYIEIPFVRVILDATLPDYYLKQDILNIIRILRLPKWNSKNSTISPLDPKSITLTKISGAMTNAIYKVEYPKLPSLLLRVYGTSNDTIIDRDYELQILARLSIRNIGPSLFGCFENGRFEQYLENSTTLGRDDIRDWKTSQRIARRMKELHSGVPLLRSEIESEPASWQKISKWLSILDTVGNHWVSNDQNVQQAFHCSDWKHFKNIIQKYRKWLYTQEKSKLVFCHNDAQYGNLLFTSPVVESTDNNPIQTESETSSLSAVESSSSLFPSESGVSLEKIINPPRHDQIQDSKLVVIDFEYAGPNPAAYDLANHLSEWMHDYSGSHPYKCNPYAFPNKEQLLNFLYSYVSHLQGGDRANRKTVIDNEVRYFYNSIIRWRATVQLFWSLWGILQSGTLEDKSDDLVRESSGPNGETYIIKTAAEDREENAESASYSDDREDADDTEGVNIDTFDYDKYCSDKIKVFWSDLITLGIVDKSDCVIEQKDFLDAKLL